MTTNAKPQKRKSRYRRKKNQWELQQKKPVVGAWNPPEYWPTVVKGKPVLDEGKPNASENETHQ
jgi:hypothetical protein